MTPRTREGVQFAGNDGKYICIYQRVLNYTPLYQRLLYYTYISSGATPLPWATSICALQPERTFPKHFDSCWNGKNKLSDHIHLVDRPTDRPTHPQLVAMVGLKCGASLPVIVWASLYMYRRQGMKSIPCAFRSWDASDTDDGQAYIPIESRFLVSISVVPSCPSSLRYYPTTQRPMKHFGVCLPCLLILIKWSSAAFCLGPSSSSSCCRCRSFATHGIYDLLLQTVQPTWLLDSGFFWPPIAEWMHNATRRQRKRATGIG